MSLVDKGLIEIPTTKEQATILYRKLRPFVNLCNKIDHIDYIGACDAAYYKDEFIVSCAVVFEYRDLKFVEHKVFKGKVSFPYIAGYLAFREGPALVEAIKRLNVKPDVVIVDGQGIAHPYSVGLATYIGIILDIPTIGCAKRLLFGECQTPENKAGAYSFIYKGKEIKGVALRPKENTKQIFISCGHKITLPQAVDIILHCLCGHRFPEPLRYAHAYSKRAINTEFDNHL